MADLNYCHSTFTLSGISQFKYLDLIGVNYLNTNLTLYMKWASSIALIIGMVLT
jgi:hypothetical protein